MLSVLVLSTALAAAPTDGARCLEAALTTAQMVRSFELLEASADAGYLAAGPLRLRSRFSDVTARPARVPILRLRIAELRLSAIITVGSSLSVGLCRSATPQPPRLAFAMPAIALPLDLRTHLRLSVLTPWLGLLRRFGEDLEVHASVGLSTSVSTQTSVSAPRPAVVAKSASVQPAGINLPKAPVPTVTLPGRVTPRGGLSPR